MMRLNPDPLQAEFGGTTRGVFTPICEFAGGRLVLETRGTDVPAQFDEDTIHRLFCYVAIAVLPSEAIKEVWETVYDQWQWHSRHRQALPVVAEPPTRMVTRVFKGTEERPFLISEE